MFLLATVAVGLSTALLTGLSLYRFLKAPFTQAAGGGVVSPSWQGKEPLSLALVLLEDRNQPTSAVTDLYILQIDPSRQRYGLVNVDVNTEVALPMGFGRSTLAQAYSQGNFLQIPQGTYFLLQALAKATAVPVQGYLITDRVGWEQLGAEFGHPQPQDLGAYFGWDKLRRPRDFFLVTHGLLRTNLEVGELGRLILFLRQAPSGNVVSWRWEAGDEEARLRLDERWRQALADLQVLAEGRRVLILNGTDRVGLASFGARVVTNLGGQVLDAGNAAHSFPTSKLVAYDPYCYTVRVLAEKLGITEVETYLESRHGEEPGVARADITVILGLDKSF